MEEPLRCGVGKDLFQLKPLKYQIPAGWDESESGHA